VLQHKPRGLRQRGYTVGCKRGRVRGRPGYRIRQGNYRVVYDINDHVLTVFILAAGHRKDIYE
jgi:mRNA interferase RelE/StbE